MRLLNATYDSLYLVWRAAILIFFSVMISGIMAAQQDSSPEGNPALEYNQDSLPGTINESPGEEATDEETDTEKLRPEYFLRKEFTGGFTDTLSIRKLDDSLMNQIKGDDAFWYANTEFKKKQPRQRSSFMAHPLFQSLLWVVIMAAFTGFLFVYLKNNNVFLFRNNHNLEGGDDEVTREDIFSLNFREEINKAVESKDYRLAVRFLFLRLLKDLSSKGFLQLGKDNTNRDYLRQLQGTPHYSSFLRLTRHFEFCWYGQFELDKEKFSAIRNEFDFLEQKR